MLILYKASSYNFVVNLCLKCMSSNSLNVEITNSIIKERKQLTQKIT